MILPAPLREKIYDTRGVMSRAWWTWFNGLSSGTVGNQPTFSDNETPGGTIDGVNVNFTLSHAPNPKESLLLFMVEPGTLGALQYGLRMIDGIGYTLSSNRITINAEYAPKAGSSLRATYRF